MARKKKTEDNTELNNNTVIQDDIDYYFIEFCNLHNIKDIYKIPAPQYVAALIYINHKYIKPNRIIYNTGPERYKYNLFAIDMLADRFLYMSYIYNQPITLLNFSHFSGINYSYICTWKHENVYITIDPTKEKEKEYIYKYNINNSAGRGGVVTIGYKQIYEKLISNQINNADMLVHYKGGVNSIAWSNRVHDKHDNRKDDGGPVFDIITAAESLGISGKIAALTDKKSDNNNNKVS